MFPLETTWYLMNISLSAHIRITSEKETLEGVEGGGMLSGAQQACPILTYRPWSTDSRETP